MKFLKNKNFWRLATLAYMGLVYYSSSQAIRISGLDSNDYKIISSIVHILMYGGLAALAIISFYQSGFKLKKSCLQGFLLAIVYGVTDEYHQSFVPGREMSFGDWLLDVFGSVLAVCFLIRLSTLRYFKDFFSKAE